MSLMCSNEKIDNTSFVKPPSKPQKADAVVQIDGVLIVRLANGRFLTSARDFHKWAYTVGHDLLPREPIVRGLAAIGYITELEAEEHMSEHRRAKERRERQFATEMVHKYGEQLGISDAVAIAIEARSDATGTGAAEGESAAIAQKDHPNDNQ